MNLLISNSIKMFRKPLLILLFLSLPLVLISQPRHGKNQRNKVSGKVMCSEENLPMPMVAVGIEELNIWTVTNMDGFFTLMDVPDGKHQLIVRCLGYTTLEHELVMPCRQDLDLKVTPESLLLGEVVVTAQRGTGIATSTTIGRSAIEHTQPSNISDIMQLLPGEVSVNPNLTGVNQLSIRENTGGNSGQKRPDAMASLGTGLRIDGAPVSNTANMQMLSTATDAGSFQSTANQGVDMRQFSVDNIESIEVVRGIPGVEEGNVLSGVVKVNLIKGATPLTTRIKVDPNIKQAYVGKGFNLPGTFGGTFNVDADVQQSLSDIRSPYRSYNRISSYMAYSNTFFKEDRPLRFTLSARLNEQRSRDVSDPDRIKEESFSSTDRAVALVMSGRWALKSLLFTNLNLNVSGNFQRQETKEKQYKNFQSVQALGTSLEAGVHEAIFIQPGYYSDVTIDGRPMYWNARLNGTKMLETGSVQHTLRAGVEYNYSVNKGNGSMFDRTRPPDPISSYGVRPRPFFDIPASVNLSYFLGDEVSLPIGSTQLELHAGLRYENIQPDGLFSSSENITSLDPRFNAKYSIFKKREALFSDLGLRFGYGRSTLTPTLLHMFPNKAYMDMSSFNYYDPPASLAVVSTYVVEDTRNYNLRAATSSKLEGGVDLKLGRLDMQITGYYEKNKDGFTNHSEYYPVVYDKYERLTQSGLSPRFIPGEGVFYNDPVSGELTAVPVRSDTLLKSHNYPVNGLDVTKYGLEFDIDFGKVESLKTDFMFNGAYRFTHRKNNNQWFNTNPVVSNQVVGLYEAGIGKINDRITTTLRSVTHIQPLAMIVSLTGQAIWMERTQNTYEDEDGNILMYTPDPTDDIYGDISQRKYYDPVAVMDFSGELRPWQPEYASQMPYSALIRNYSNEHFVPFSYLPAFQLNMRLTKELSSNATISFSVNNLTYYEPLQITLGRVNETYVRRNSSTYFSGELTIKI